MRPVDRAQALKRRVWAPKLALRLNSIVECCCPIRAVIEMVTNSNDL